MPQPQHVVVDGSNLATEGRAMPSLAQLNDAVLAFIDEHPDALITVVVDATFGHRIDSSEVKEFDAAVSNNELVAPPAGAIGRGDAFLLSIANKVGATVLSNDSFQEFHGTYTWLFDEGRLVGGKPVPHIGWVFVPRVPVRGPISRTAVKDARRKKAGGVAPPGKPAKRSTSPEASRPMPVPKAPPPNATLRGAVSSATEPAAAPAPKAPAAAAATPAGGAAKTGTVNELLPFLSFVEHNPIGTVVHARVESYSSHGAYVRLVDDVVGYVPLRMMSDPAPRSAREFMTIGDEITLVVESFAPTRRSIDLATVAMATAKPPAPKKATRAKKGAAPVDAAAGALDVATKEVVAAAIAAAEPAELADTVVPELVGAETSRRGRGRRGGRGAGATRVADTVAAETAADAVPSPVEAAAAPEAAEAADVVVPPEIAAAPEQPETAAPARAKRGEEAADERGIGGAGNPTEPVATEPPPPPEPVAAEAPSSDADVEAAATPAPTPRAPRKRAAAAAPTAAPTSTPAPTPARTRKAAAKRATAPEPPEVAVAPATDEAAATDAPTPPESVATPRPAKRRAAKKAVAPSSDDRERCSRRRREPDGSRRARRDGGRRCRRLGDTRTRATAASPSRFGLNFATVAVVRIATWNVNSLKVRLPRVEEWLVQVQPDVLCMQETKLADDAFPALTFASLGYESVHHGQGQWNGVAILSKVGIENVVGNFHCTSGDPDPDVWIITARCGGIVVTSVYVPNGRSLTDPHYQYKLAWLAQLRRHLDCVATPDQPVILTGDFNIAPDDRDVYDPSKFVDSTHTSAEERELLAELHRWGLTDLFRARYEDSRIYSWWDYRAGDFHQGRGLRIDLVLGTAPVAERLEWCIIDRNARKGTSPSDHAPVVVDLAAI